MNTAVRMPAVAGQFYPGQAQALEHEVEEYTRFQGEKIAARGCLVPHAGYMYSGHVAGAVYGKLALPRRFIILCPNHTGLGKPLAIMSSGAWKTPLGNAAVDEKLAESLKRNSPLFSEDAEAHRREHALEVQLPFLQKLQPDFTFVPIVVGTSRYEALEGVGKAIAAAIEEEGADGAVLVAASSDMNHYESDEITRAKDARALDRILALDAPGLYEAIARQQISMCGFGPAIAMLTAARRLGATRAELVRYATSGDISGDRKAVVGYAGVVVL
jgi:hypothetical protein